MNQLTVPDYLKDIMANDETQRQNAGLVSATTSVPRISLKGRRFKLINGDEEEKIQQDHLDVVILGVTPKDGNRNAKTYYKESYDPESAAPPDCSSMDGVRPDSWISNPVHDNCAQCPMNAWGSATGLSGKRAKACHDSKMLAVVKPKEIDGTVYMLKVTVSSLKQLTKLGKELMAMNAPMSAAVIRISFQDTDFPAIEFKILGFLNEEVGKKAIARSNKREWDESVSLPPPAQQTSAEPEQNVQNERPKPEERKASAPSDIDDILEGWGD